MIVTQNTGAIKYSVSDSVEEKATIVKKKPPINVWLVCKELAIIHEESRSSTNKTVTMDISVLYNYFDENLTKIEAVAIYGICTCDRPEGLWDFPFEI